MTAIDVNEAFAAERRTQIQAASEATAAWDQRVADGKLVPIGNGQFKVNDPGSWDDGEVFIQRDGIAVPQSGLEMVNGKAQLYTAVPAWHELGNVVKDGTSDVSEVLRLGGIDFEIGMTDQVYGLVRGRRVTVPGKRITYRKDTNAGLGVVGNVYRPVQPRQSFEFLQELTGKGDAIWETAGLLRGGRRIFVTLRLPETVVIDEGGIADEIQVFIAVLDSFDGTSPYTAKMTPWRILCANTERFASRDAVSSWAVRHTTNAPSRAQEARRTLGLSLKYVEAFKAEEEKLARTDIELREFESLMADLWAEPDEPTDRQKNLIAGRKDDLHELFATETARSGRTAYAAERTVTDYLDHVAPRRAAGDRLAAARATAILEGADDDKKSKAHRQLLTLVNR